jgi:hypothetical protein
MRLLAPVGVHFSEAVLAAGVIAIRFDFGSTASGAAVQTYPNRRVPLANQGATFGIQSQVVSALTIVTMLSLGALATLLGTPFAVGSETPGRVPGGDRPGDSVVRAQRCAGAREIRQNESAVSRARTASSTAVSA